LPTTASAKKRLRQAEKRRLRNRVHLSQARSYVKRTNSLLNQGQWEEAAAAAEKAASVLDRAAQKGVIHKKNAARRKSRLFRRLRRAQPESGN
jgi:small subunit ribosomal protein S20